MSATPKGGPPRTALSSLRRFVRPRTVVERCELCNAALATDHAHLVELSNRRLVCACEACAILPLCFLFSGTIFYEAENGALQVAQIAWDKEASFRLPAATWKGLMDLYYPNSAWLCLRKDVFDLLNQYRSRQGLPTWEQALERLLTAAEEPVQP